MSSVPFESDWVRHGGYMGFLFILFSFLCWFSDVISSYCFSYFTPFSFWIHFSKAQPSCLTHRDSGWQTLNPYISEKTSVAATSTSLSDVWHVIDLQAPLLPEFHQWVHWGLSQGWAGRHRLHSGLSTSWKPFWTLLKLHCSLRHSHPPSLLPFVWSQISTEVWQLVHPWLPYLSHVFNLIYFGTNNPILACFPTGLRLAWHLYFNSH